MQPCENDQEALRRTEQAYDGSKSCSAVYKSLLGKEKLF